MLNVSKVELWRDHHASCARSGLTVREYCERNSLCTKSYYYWKRRLACTAAVGAPAEPGDLAGPSSSWLRLKPVSCLPVDRSQSLTVKISGAEIEVGPDFNPALLRCVVEALRAQPC